MPVAIVGTGNQKIQKAIIKLMSSLRSRAKKISSNLDFFSLMQSLRNSWIDLLVIGVAFGLFAMSLFFLVALDDTDNMLGGKLILEGQLPYRDFFSHHSPGMYFLSALIYPFTDNNLFFYRLIFNLLVFCLAVWLYFILKNKYSPIVARVFLLLFSFAHTVGYMHLALGESLIAVIIPIAFVMVFDQNRYLFSHSKSITLSLLLFCVPFMSLSYVFAAIILYITYAALCVITARANRWIILAKLTGIYATPYVIAALYIILTGSFDYIWYDLFVFNALHYAPMVGEHGGNIVNTLSAMILNSISQIATVGSNILNPQYTVQLFSLTGIGVFCYYLYRNNKRLEVLSVIALLLVLNTRTNIYNAPAISSSFLEISQHAALYVSMVLLLGTIGIISVLNTRGNQALKVIGVLYLIVISAAILQVWSSRMQDVFITKESQNYYTYAHNLKRINTSTLINQLTVPGDKAWIAPTDFASQLYLTPQRSSRYTFYLPWLNSSPRLTDDLVASLRADMPKVIYLAPYSMNGQEYSRELSSFIDNNYFEIDDQRLENYYYLKSEHGAVSKKLEGLGYRTEKSSL